MNTNFALLLLNDMIVKGKCSRVIVQDKRRNPCGDHSAQTFLQRNLTTRTSKTKRECPPKSLEAQYILYNYNSPHMYDYATVKQLRNQLADEYAPAPPTSLPALGQYHWRQNVLHHQGRRQCLRQPVRHHGRARP